MRNERGLKIEVVRLSQKFQGSASGCDGMRRDGEWFFELRILNSNRSRGFRAAYPQDLATVGRNGGRWFVELNTFSAQT